MITKLAGAVIDWYDDPDFICSPEAAVFFQEGALIPPEETSRLPDNAFAVMIKTAAGTHRKFPVYNQYATILSAEVFEKVASELPEEVVKAAGYTLQRYCKEYGIPWNHNFDQANAYVMWPDHTKEAAYDPAIPQDTPQEAFAMATQEFLESSFTPEERVQRAWDIVKLGEALGLPVDQRVIDYYPKGSLGPYFEQGMKDREHMVKEASDPMLQGKFTRIVEHMVVQDTPLEKAVLLHEFDKMAGFDLQEIADAFYTCFANAPMQKTAAEAAEESRDLETVKKRRLLERLGNDVQRLRRVFKHSFITRFTNDPFGTYAKANPETRKLLDQMISAYTWGDVPKGDNRKLLAHKNKMYTDAELDDIMRGRVGQGASPHLLRGDK